MKKSKCVPATFVAGFAAAMIAGCGSHQPQQRACVDANGNVVPEIMCRQATPSGVVVGHWGYPGQVYSHGAYVSGGGGGGFVSGGGTGARAGGATGSAVARGGFGMSAGGFGSGG